MLSTQDKSSSTGGNMAAAAMDKAKTAANEMLHRLLDLRKIELGITEQQRVEPEQFFPVEPRVLLREIGWTLDQVDMVGHTSSGEEILAKCIKAEKRILVLGSLLDDVKRFTIAHELGHVRLHTDIPECNGGSLPRVQSMRSAAKKDRRDDFPVIEREAEVFARELLMPEKAVRHHFLKLFGLAQLRAASSASARFAPRAHKNRTKNVRDVAQEISKWASPSARSIADFFGVSPKSMSSRLLGLSLVI
jgi:hypothetical protein